MNRTSLQTNDTRQISYHMILTKYLVFTISWTSWCLRAWPLSLFGASDFLRLGKGGGGGRSTFRWFTHSHLSLMVMILSHVFLWFCEPYISFCRLYFPCFQSYIYILQGVFLRRVRQEEVLRWFAHSHLSLMVMILSHEFLWFCIHFFVDPIPHVLKVHFQILQMREAGRSGRRSDDLHMHTCLSSKLCTY